MFPAERCGVPPQIVRHLTASGSVLLLHDETTASRSPSVDRYGEVAILYRPILNSNAIPDSPASYDNPDSPHGLANTPPPTRVRATPNTHPVLHPGGKFASNRNSTKP